MSHSSSSQSTIITGMLTLEELREKIKKGDIDQVIISFPDMYGRLMGKISDGDFFLESIAKEGAYCCSGVVLCDMKMQVQPNYTRMNCQTEFSDFHLVPDMASLRLMSWKDKSASVICDIYDNDNLVPFIPRSILRRQIAAASNLSYNIISASELEYYTYENSYHDARTLNYEKSKLRPISDYSAVYHLLQAAREEKYTSAFRHHLKMSGIPVENSHGEYGQGQHELTVKFTDLLSMADRHVTYKQCLKEIADQMGISVTFMAKPFTDLAGSSSHLHLSITNIIDGTNLFNGDEQLAGSNIKCSALFKHFLAGWMKYIPDMMVFYAPTVNSYKRFINLSLAPTRIAWSYDNRTASFRVVGQGQSLRIECRIPGADCNIYLAFAAALASGLRGIKDKLPLPPMCKGDIYEEKDLSEVPRTLKDAVHIFENSTFAREAFGDDVVNYYTAFYHHEQAVYDTFVTDWERHRYFEQI